MHWLNLPRVDEDELMDDPEQPSAAIGASMADLARVNRLFGGIDAVVGAVAGLSGCHAHSPGWACRRRSVYEASRGAGAVPLRILDIGTGSGDIPRALVRWAEANDIDIHVVAVDNLPGMLRLARICTRADAPIDYVRADALALPFPPASFDIVTCNLMLHHLGIDSSAKVLAEMDRLSTRGFVATDLRRDRVSLALVSTGLALMRAHPITRHDGPASVRRAFTRREYERMVALSGVRGVRVESSWYYRVVLVKEK